MTTLQTPSFMTMLDSLNPLWLVLFIIAGVILRRHLILIILAGIMIYVLWQWASPSFKMNDGLSPINGDATQGLPIQLIETKADDVFRDLKKVLTTYSPTQESRAQGVGKSSPISIPLRKSDKSKDACLGRTAEGYEVYTESAWENQKTAQGVQPMTCESGCQYQAVQFTVETQKSTGYDCHNGKKVKQTIYTYTVAGRWKTTGAGCLFTIDVTANSERDHLECE